MFSFVDLAFLMLIAMTQLASDVGADAPDLGELVVPRIGGEAAPVHDLASDASRSWQLRVHPRDAEVVTEVVFELVPSDDASGDSNEIFSEVTELSGRLAALQDADASRPLLAPHQDSRSQDMLDAAAAIETQWPGKRRATVARAFD